VRAYNSYGQGGIYLPVYLVAADRPLDAPVIKAVLDRNVQQRERPG
jgi:hypothetical protein